MSKRTLYGLAVIFLCGAGIARALTYEGVNLSGAEFGYPGDVPGTYGTAYTYPTANEVNYYVGKGMNTFRLPFLWERLEPDLASGQLDGTQLGYITNFVSQVMTATNGNGYVVLDPHDFGQYVSGGVGHAIGSPEVTVDDYANFWSQLATAFVGNTHVLFGLMNEPVGTPVITTEAWFTAAQSAVNAIRTAGATNTILAPGNYYTGAWSWVTGNGNGMPNAQIMGGLVDPGVNGSARNIVYEVHQYFDSNYSGTSPNIDHPDVVSLFSDFTNWLIATGNKGFLGEFGVSENLNGGTAQQDAATTTLNYLEANADLWEGWTWWAGGPWWPADYFLSIEPTGLGGAGDPVDAPQMAYLAPFLSVPEPSSGSLLFVGALALLLYAAACTARNLTSPISSSSASSATRKNPSVASVSATCKLPS